MKVSIQLSGLIAYATTESTIDALILASREGHGHGGHDHHGDVHVPLLIMPLSAVRPGKGSAASDYIFDAGGEEYGAWRLTDTIVTAVLDRKKPSGEVSFKKSGTGKIPTYANEGSLYWLPSIAKAADMACTFRRDCLPPYLNPKLVTAAVRMADGTAQSMWTSLEARTQVFKFVSPPGAKGGLPPYEQALADGITWTLLPQKSLEIRLKPVKGRGSRSIFLKVTNAPDVLVTLSNKAATLDGVPAFEPNPLVSHFDMFYDVVTPEPQGNNRRLPRGAGVTTKTNRCPGSAG